jgi:glycosyltransferase involved in cell wall biosynthesis
MGTRNGEAFLGAQLQSIAEQSHADWLLAVSDDGSGDRTKEIVQAFAVGHAGKVSLRDGPRRGASANFLSLAVDPAIEADYFAFGDQDDVWQPDKLRRALQWLAAVPAGVPALYCGRTEVIAADGRRIGLSPLFTRPPAFENAIVQSLAGGNTMVFNRAAKRLMERAGPLDVVLHDWWLYQLVSAAGGEIRYDPQPMLRYRQHAHSLIGSNIGWWARLLRIALMLGGRFRAWNTINIAALETLPADMLRPRAREVLTLFTKARNASILKRLVHLRRAGIYRQTPFGNLALVVAAIVKRI